MTTTKTTTTVAVWGPNLRGPASGSLHVHKPGCADTTRGIYRGAEDPWVIEVDSFKHLVEEHYGPQAGSFFEEAGHAADDPDAWRDYASEFKVFPCLPALPEEAS